jgi:DNA-binding PadR family transcriptional regulator
MGSDQRDPQNMLPLNATLFQILVSLSEGPRHGYAVMQDITARTEGEVVVLPGTLYSSLKRMLLEGLLEECAAPKDVSKDDARRRYYRVTPFGREVAKAETERMARLIGFAVEKKLTDLPGSASGGRG